MATPERVAIRTAQAAETQAGALQEIARQLVALSASVAALDKKIDALLKKKGGDNATS